MKVESLFPEVFAEACCGKGTSGEDVFDPNYKPLQKLCLKIWNAALAASDTNGFRVTCDDTKSHEPHVVCDQSDEEAGSTWYRCEGVK